MPDAKLPTYHSDKTGHDEIFHPEILKFHHSLSIVVETLQSESTQQTD